MPKDYININKNKVANFTVSNPSEEYKAVEVNVLERKHTLERKEDLIENSDFIIIPAQFVLGPQQDRVVSLKWVGDASQKTEKPYRIVTEEVLFKKDKQEAGKSASAKVKIRLRFVNSFYAKPKNIAPNIVAESLIPTENNQHLLTIINQGTEHKIVKYFKIDVLDHKTQIKTIAVTNKLFKGNQNLLPGDKLKVLIPSTNQLTPKIYNVHLHHLND